MVKIYQRKARGRVYSQLEVRTKKEHGSKRADGFLAFRNWVWGTYTVSMEAKSYKTLPAVRPFFDMKKYIVSCIRTGLLFALVGAGISYALDWDEGGIFLFFPGMLFLLGGLLNAVLRHDSFRNYQMKVIDQVAQYPANEQWLALSSDTLDSISTKRVETLKSLCSRKGIGLILVRSRKSVEVVVQPRQRWHAVIDFLRYYAKEEEIRAYLHG